jgi:hypothetical protein
VPTTSANAVTTESDLLICSAKILFILSNVNYGNCVIRVCSRS